MESVRDEKLAEYVSTFRKEAIRARLFTCFIHEVVWTVTFVILCWCFPIFIFDQVKQFLSPNLTVIIGTALIGFQILPFTIKFVRRKYNKHARKRRIYKRAYYLKNNY